MNKVNVIIGVIVAIAVVGGLYWKSHQGDVVVNAQGVPQQSVPASAPNNGVDPYASFGK